MLRPTSSTSVPNICNRVLVLSGPTATGKSAVAVEIARRLGGEIVSADSVQMYKRLDVGSGKVTSAEMRGVPHHCIDVFEPSDDVGTNNAAQFHALARACIDGILARGATPIVVGGSGMYLSFLLYGPPPTGPPPPPSSTPSPPPLPPPPAFGANHSPADARSPHSNDSYRMKRRRDIEAVSGCVPVYSGLLPDRHLLPLDYDFVCVSMYCDRVQSFRRIDRRVEQMVCNGLLLEVLRLYSDGALRPSSMAARAIGYRHALQFLAQHQVALLRDDWVEEFDSSSPATSSRPPSEKCRRPANSLMHNALLHFVSLMQAATRQYSTRQLTWFKGDKRWLWFDVLPKDGCVDVDACADRLSEALRCAPPAASPAFSSTLPQLTKAEVTQSQGSITAFWNCFNAFLFL